MHFWLMIFSTYDGVIGTYVPICSNTDQGRSVFEETIPCPEIQLKEIIPIASSDLCIKISFQSIAYNREE